MKQLIENYVTQTMGEGFIQDLKLVLGERFNLFDMINPETLRHPDSEAVHRKDRLKKSINRVLQVYNTTAEETAKGSSYELYSDPQARVIYINGMATKLSLANHQTRVLSKAIGQPVELVYNETEGVFRDLLECSEGREGVLNDEAEKTISVIERKLTEPGELNIIAHSQGAIIGTSALLYLADRLPPAELSRINYMTFGAGFRSSPLPETIYSEHFANIHDPVTRLGLQQDDYPCSGEIYLRDVKGHLFIADYITPMREGVRYGDSHFENALLKRITPVDYA